MASKPTVRGRQCCSHSGVQASDSTAASHPVSLSPGAMLSTAWPGLVLGTVEHTCSTNEHQEERNDAVYSAMTCRLGPTGESNCALGEGTGSQCFCKMEPKDDGAKWE